MFSGVDKKRRVVIDWLVGLACWPEFLDDEVDVKKGCRSDVALGVVTVVGMTPTRTDAFSTSRRGGWRSEARTVRR